MLRVQTVVTTEPPESAGGGRSYAFWLLVAVVLLVAVFNRLITLTRISGLRISVGMESIQVRRAALNPAVRSFGNLFIRSLHFPLLLSFFIIAAGYRQMY